MTRLEHRRRAPAVPEIFYAASAGACPKGGIARDDVSDKTTIVCIVSKKHRDVSEAQQCVVTNGYVARRSNGNEPSTANRRGRLPHGARSHYDTCPRDDCVQCTISRSMIAVSGGTMPVLDAVSCWTCSSARRRLISVMAPSVTFVCCTETIPR